MKNNITISTLATITTLSFACFAGELDDALRNFIFTGKASVVVEKPGFNELVSEDASEIKSLTLDIDGDGKEEFILGAGGDNRWSRWTLYGTSHHETDKVEDLGSLEVNMSTMRIGARDGKRGYYDYIPGGAGKGILSFNSFDANSHLVVLWEKEVSPGGEDKDLFNRIYSSDDFSTPHVVTWSTKDLKKKFYNTINNDKRSLNRPKTLGPESAIIGGHDHSKNITKHQDDPAIKKSSLAKFLITASLSTLIIIAAIFWRKKSTKHI